MKYSDSPDVEKVIIFKRNGEIMKSRILYVSMFQCSNYKYFLISTLVTAMSLASMNLWQNENKAESIGILLEIPGYSVACFIIWYTLQRRELKSFIRERRASIKQEQVTKVFDSQSDAIVVI